MKRGDFLSHVGWTGAGILWTLGPTGLAARAVAQGMGSQPAAFSFVQISDSHIGFHQAANPDVSGTLSAAIEAINALETQPAFVIHTGDITHLAKPEQFDTAKQLLSSLRAPLFTLPGEHDFLGSDPGKAYFGAFAGDRVQHSGTGWYSWDQAGTHFIALVNVFNFEKMGLLGSDQLSWLERDLQSQKSQTPIVVFAHVPLYALYEAWGWTTQDGAKALAMLQRFDRVTVLNGHIHQVVHHEEGNIRFASADATAYPQPAPGTAAKPGPVTLPHAQLLKAIGYRTVTLTSSGAGVADKTMG